MLRPEQNRGWRNMIQAVMTDRAHGPAAACGRPVLLAASWLFGGLVALRGWAYDRGLFRPTGVGRPVISIGNLVAGGTGKTPLVLGIAEHVLARGRSCAVVARGYRTGGGASAGPDNDELFMIREILPGLPTAGGADRVNVTRHLLLENPVDVVLLDDGFQHRRIHRDLDIVTIDATSPFGNGHLLPRGTLREPPSALRRADAVVITKSDLVQAGALQVLVERIRALAPGRPVAAAVHRPAAVHVLPDGSAEPVATYSGRTVAALCGIAGPDGFSRTLAAAGMTVGRMFAFPDHHEYTEAELNEVYAVCRNEGWPLLTTQKDAVKLRDHPDRSAKPCAVRALAVRLEITTGAEEIFGRIDCLLDD